MVIVTSPATPADSMHELVTLAKSKPGEVSYGTSGNGGSTHLAGAMLENATGTKMINVPFKGNGPALAEVMAGRVTFMFYPIVGIADQVSAKKLKVLAVGPPGPHAGFPAVPPLEQSGLPGFEGTPPWVGRPAPAGGPRPAAIFDFVDGAAEDETTLRENRAAFERARIAPKMLTGVAQIDTSANILGARAELPIAIGPTGGIGFGWPFADVGVARAAAAAGIPYTLSTMATASIERIAREAGGRLWFQAYIFRQRGMTLGLVERARQLGYEALMVTVDVPVGGKRERDFRHEL